MTKGGKQFLGVVFLLAVFGCVFAFIVAIAKDNEPNPVAYFGAAGAFAIGAFVMLNMAEADKGDSVPPDAAERSAPASDTPAPTNHRAPTDERPRLPIQWIALVVGLLVLVVIGVVVLTQRDGKSDEEVTREYAENFKSCAEYATSQVPPNATQRETLAEMTAQGCDSIILEYFDKVPNYENPDLQAIWDDVVSSP